MGIDEQAILLTSCPDLDRIVADHGSFKPSLPDRESARERVEEFWFFGSHLMNRTPGFTTGSQTS